MKRRRGTEREIMREKEERKGEITPLDGNYFRHEKRRKRKESRKKEGRRKERRGRRNLPLFLLRMRACERARGRHCRREKERGREEEFPPRDGNFSVAREKRRERGRVREGREKEKKKEKREEKERRREGTRGIGKKGKKERRKNAGERKVTGEKRGREIFSFQF